MSTGKWERKKINDLPDAAFAYIEKGGTKDETGRTVPRTLRHLPHHSMAVKTRGEDKTVNKAHLRNALARLPLTEMPEEGKRKAKNHLSGHARRLGIG